MELIVDRISKQYQNKIAVDRISLKFTRGIYGLLGKDDLYADDLRRLKA